MASATIRQDIFDRPALRSTNTMGVSTSRNPARAARSLSSIWKAYPSLRTRSRGRVSSTLRRQALYPPVRSRMGRPRISRAYALPKRLMARRTGLQLAVPPPGT